MVKYHVRYYRGGEHIGTLQVANIRMAKLNGSKADAMKIWKLNSSKVPTEPHGFYVTSKSGRLVKVYDGNDPAYRELVKNRLHKMAMSEKERQEKTQEIHKKALEQYAQNAGNVMIEFTEYYEKRVGLLRKDIIIDFVEEIRDGRIQPFQRA